MIGTNDEPSYIPKQMPISQTSSTLMIKTEFYVNQKKGQR